MRYANIMRRGIVALTRQAWECCLSAGPERSVVRWVWCAIGLYSITTTAVAQAPPVSQTAPQTAPQGAPRGAPASDPVANRPATSESEEETLPRLADLVLPEAQELLTARPYDRIVLNRNEEVLTVEPVQPRPDTLFTLETGYRQLAASPAPATELDREQRRLKLQQLQRLVVTLWDDPDAVEYQLEPRNIKQVIHFEDLILQRVDQCLQTGEFAVAQDLLTRLLGLQTEWPNTTARLHRLWYLDSAARLANQQPEEALRLIADLIEAAPDYVGTRDLLTSILNTLATNAEQQGDYRQVRFFLKRSARLIPDLPAVSVWIDKLTARTQQLHQAALGLEATDARAAIVACEQAVSCWPELPGLRDTHRRLALLYPIVRIGVIEPGTPFGNPLTRPADARTTALVSLPLFEVTQVGTAGVRYGSRVFRRWDPADLGRRLDLQVIVQPGQGSPRALITSQDVLVALQRQGSASRVGQHLLRMQVDDPARIQLEFDLAPLRPEPLLSTHIRLTAATAPLQADWPPALTNPATNALRAALPQAGQVRYFQAAAEANDRSYRPVAFPAAGGGVQEIIERTYPDWESQLQALLRGEVDGAFPVHSQDIALLRQDTRFFVLPAATPIVHWLQFSPTSWLADQSGLRRALGVALNRRSLLQTVFWRGATDGPGRLAVSLCPLASPMAPPAASNTEPDLVLAATLVGLARRARNQTEFPPIRLGVGPAAELRAAARLMIETWSRVGLTVELVPDDSPSDLQYRAARVLDPTVSLFPLLSPTGETSVESLQDWPGWVRQQLLDLEQAPDRPTTLRRTQDLQARLVADTRIVPLWELDEFLVIRRHVTGIPQPWIQLYQYTEQWRVQPWFRNDDF